MPQKNALEEQFLRIIWSKTWVQAVGNILSKVQDTYDQTEK